MQDRNLLTLTKTSPELDTVLVVVVEGVRIISIVMGYSVYAVEY
jgi:hypothetical protein